MDGWMDDWADGRLNRCMDGPFYENNLNKI